MNFAEQLQKAAEESGQRTVQGQALGTPDAQKHDDMDSFAAALQSSAADTAKVTQQEGQDAEADESAPTGKVKIWSFSALKNFEECPHRVERERVLKEKRPDSEASERGTAVHETIEDYIRGKIDAPNVDRRVKLNYFAKELERLRAEFHKGHISMEENWGIRIDWSPCSWDDPELWGRAKLDVFEQESPTSVVITDWKTGRKFGNEAKHSDQGLSYALHVINRYPEVQFVRIRFAYLDEGAWMERDFTRRQLQVLQPRAHKRAAKMTNCVVFQPKPGPDSCRFCAYGHNVNKHGVPYGIGTCPHDWYGDPE